MIPEDLVRRITQLERRLDVLNLPEVGRWVDWTPTITQGVSVTSTTTYAKFLLANNSVTIRARLAITSAGTIANNIVIAGIPYAPAFAGNIFGVIRVTDTGTADYVGGAAIQLLYSTCGPGP